jgi:hypothetical protein
MQRIQVSAHTVKVHGALLDRYTDTVLDHGEMCDGTVVVWTGDTVGRRLHVYHFYKNRLVHATHEVLVGEVDSRLTVGPDSFSINVGDTILRSGKIAHRRPAPRRPESPT